MFSEDRQAQRRRHADQRCAPHTQSLNVPDHRVRRARVEPLFAIRKRRLVEDPEPTPITAQAE
jgi:hypothetical protein